MISQFPLCFHESEEAALSKVTLSGIWLNRKIEKDLFVNSTFNALTGNYTVKQIIDMIKKFKKGVKIKFVKTKIMNQLSYQVDNQKLNKFGLKLKKDIKKDIKETLNLLKGLK